MRCECHSPESLWRRRRPNIVHWGNRRHRRWHIMKCHHWPSKSSHVRARRRRGAHEGRSDGQRRGWRRCAPHVRPDAHPWATVEAIKPASPAATKPAVMRNSTTSWAAWATVATAPPATAVVIVVASLATPPAAMVPAAGAPLLVIPRGVVSTAGASAPSRLVAAVVSPGAVPGRVGRVRHGR